MTALVFISCVMYILIALFAATMTYCEQKAVKTVNPMCKFLGYAACALWPITLLGMTVAAATVRVRA